MARLEAWSFQLPPYEPESLTDRPMHDAAPLTFLPPSFELKLGADRRSAIRSDRVGRHRQVEHQQFKVFAVAKRVEIAV